MLHYTYYIRIETYILPHSCLSGLDVCIHIPGRFVFPVLLSLGMGKRKRGPSFIRVKVFVVVEERC